MCLKLSTIVKKTSFTRKHSVMIDIMICLLLDVKEGSIANLRAIKSKILEKKYPNRRQFHPSIYLQRLLLHNLQRFMFPFTEKRCTVLTREINTVPKLFLKDIQNIKNISL